MSLPQPAVPLEDSCSTLFNNTLYTYTSQAFQSLPIVQGAIWADLSMGVAVSGGVCVKSTPPNNTAAAALWIVGGQSNDTNYQGLQRYTFADEKWETLTPSTAVTQNRLYHNAVYLNSSDSILIYAGTQDGSKQATSQTFTIQASEPYSVLAYEAFLAPPAISPLLIPWSESEAVYIGGSDTNTKAMLFSATSSWEDSNSTLAVPISDSSIKAVIINGDDSSKSMYTFDMSVSPNKVNRTILVDGNGNPVQNAQAQPHKRDLWEERPAKRVRRSTLTVADWPAYNDTLAPSSTRTAYSIARDQSGLVVISGGNESDVLCMFKARDNCWVNATQVLSKAQTDQASGLGSAVSAASVPSTTPSETTAASASSAAVSAASATSAPSMGNNSDPPVPVKVLGAVLGSILGFALLFLGILFLLRWRQKRRYYADLGHQRRSSGIPDEKDAMGFPGPRIATNEHDETSPWSRNQCFTGIFLINGNFDG
ncbi:hypothetical protein G7Y89_g2922 [Cudoniella acicularis]|uniref:Uncharacterized protein n=1 Tax=Cudoniella acicularis TaxID=354080 RepID=A0A8H4RVD0_9HELO|nr:hypothetical protein G7Y89_g2922 [Cudoniella acicularis]